MTLALTIRSEVPLDAGAIDTITRAAFEGHPLSRQTEHFIVRALRGADALSASLVAVLDGAVIGHVAVSPVRVGGQMLGWFGLGPVSVVPAYQRKGVGSALVRAVLERLTTTGAGGCVLLGDPAYYGRFGFAKATGLHLAGVPEDHFLSLAWAEPVPAGEVTYHPAFNAVG